MLKNMSKVSKLDTDVWKMENGQEKYNACPKAWEVIKQSSAINIPSNTLKYTGITGCCKQVVFYETNSTSSFFYGYSSFLGIWYQVMSDFSFFLSFAKHNLKTGTEVNGKPLYRKVGNERVHLSFSNVTKEYPTPWTMWGGSPGDHIGNIKIGPAQLRCPEDNPVRFFKKNIFCHLSYFYGFAILLQ